MKMKFICKLYFGRSRNIKGYWYIGEPHALQGARVVREGTFPRNGGGLLS
jgi:hypothetical protein